MKQNLLCICLGKEITEIIKFINFEKKNGGGAGIFVL
jgi:hypothetical protein